MRRIRIFLIILAVSLGFLLVLVGASVIFSAIAPSSYQSSWMRQMWGGTNGMNGMNDGLGMMGSGYSPSYLWFIPVGLIGVAVIGVIGAIFYFAFPEMVPATASCKAVGNQSVPVNPKVEAIPPPPSQPQVLNGLQNPCEAISRTLTPEERKVLSVLTAHQGKYLQKYIRKEAGLSRLKTHRIIARFAERGMVTLKKSGNTNEIILSDWLNDSKALNPV